MAFFMRAWNVLRTFPRTAPWNFLPRLWLCALLPAFPFARTASRGAAAALPSKPKVASNTVASAITRAFFVIFRTLLGKFASGFDGDRARAGSLRYQHDGEEKVSVPKGVWLR